MKHFLKHHLYQLVLLMSVVTLILPLNAAASSDADIAFIIDAKKPPAGIIFEIVEGSESDFAGALAMVNKYIKQVKQAKPALKLAIVSHGIEQFALLKENRKRYNKSHKKVQSLLSEDVPVHVCGTHASWYGLAAEDFPDYIDVAVSGPAKIIEYQRKGYALVKIDIPFD